MSLKSLIQIMLVTVLCFFLSSAADSSMRVMSQKEMVETVGAQGIKAGSYCDYNYGCEDYSKACTDYTSLECPGESEVTVLRGPVGQCYNDPWDWCEYPFGPLQTCTVFKDECYWNEAGFCGLNHTNTDSIEGYDWCGTL